MTEGLEIRRYDPRDRDSCRSLWRELTEWHRRIYEDPSIGGANPEDGFDRHLARVTGENLWVAALGVRVVGLIGLIFREDEAEIEPVVVSEVFRRKGIGRRLVERAVAEARTRGVRVLSVKPVARNEDGIAFFYEQGFRNLGHIELFVDLSDRPWRQGPRLFNRQFSF